MQRFSRAQCTTGIVISMSSQRGWMIVDKRRAGFSAVSFRRGSQPLEILVRFLSFLLWPWPSVALLRVSSRRALTRVCVSRTIRGCGARSLCGRRADRGDGALRRMQRGVRTRYRTLWRKELACRRSLSFK
eukprot:Rmarinus@m.9624